MLQNGAGSSRRIPISLHPTITMLPPIEGSNLERALCEGVDKEGSRRIGELRAIEPTEL